MQTDHQPAQAMQTDIALRASRITVSVVREDSLDGPAMKDPSNIVKFWHSVIATQPDHEPDKENLVVVLIDVRLHPYAWNRVSLGSLTEATAHPREIFRPVIAAAAHSFVMLHNHPSGDPAPSAADRAVTRRIADAAHLLQIRLLDHLIIGNAADGDDGYFSFAECGMI
jgi:DNA repair protein RadC